MGVTLLVKFMIKDIMQTTNGKELHKSRQTMYNAASKYRQLYINPITKAVKKHLVEKRVCPVCKQQKERQLFVKNGGRYVQCTNCLMVYLNPVLKDKHLANYYANNHTAQARAHENESRFYSRIYTQGLKHIVKFKRRGTLLDIGCSAGFFLKIAAEHGLHGSGIELNKKEALQARKAGFRVYEKQLAHIRPAPKADIITLWDVFEHVKDGIALLKDIKKHLDQSGIVFMQIPNVASFAARALQYRCNMFDGIEHTNLYSPATIRIVAKKAGYQILALSTVIAEDGPALNYLNYEEPYSGSFRPPEDLQWIKPSLLLKKQLGYKMQIVLKSI